MEFSLISETMFLKFQSQDDRRKYGGSCFIELQFCKVAVSEVMEDIFKHYDNWQNDSLYVHGDSQFYTIYSSILGHGVYPNLKEGYFDPWGITYFKSCLIEEIIERAIQSKPVGYEVLVEWLNEAKKYNGFFVLGL